MIHSMSFPHCLVPASPRRPRTQGAPECPESSVRGNLAQAGYEPMPDRERSRIEKAVGGMTALFRAPLMYSVADGHAPLTLTARRDAPGRGAARFGPAGVRTAERVFRALSVVETTTQDVYPGAAGYRAESTAPC